LRDIPPDGSVAARFSTGGMTHEAVEREALKDLLRMSPEVRERRSG
jgi:hypothetical protein